MPKGIFKNFKNEKIKWFLFFLCLATLFWVLTKFGKEFTTTIQAKIQYSNIPETTALSDKNIRNLTFDLTANGFEILFYKFKKPIIEVDVGKYFLNDKDSFTIPRYELLRKVASNFNRNLSVKNLSVDELTVYLDPIILKKVRVIANVKISFEDGFKAVDSIKVIPDSVTISGPLGSLKKINSVETEPLSFDKIDKSISVNAKIAKRNDNIVSIKPKSVALNLAVAEFSQGKYTLPVTVLNLPPGIEIKLVPNVVTVSFDVSITEFAKITTDDFRIVCDYSKRNTEESFMIPYLAKHPKNSMNVVFEPKKIDFFIFK